MAELGSALAIVLSVNVLLFLGQAAALEMNPEGTTFYNCEGSLIAGFESQGCAGSNYTLKDDEPTSSLPQDSASVDTGDGSIFTDTYNAVRSWITQSTGLNYLYNILAAPSNFLKALGLPAAFSFAIGAMWYGFTLFLIVSYLFGRDY